MCRKALNEALREAVYLGLSEKGIPQGHLLILYYNNLIRRATKTFNGKIHKIRGASREDAQRVTSFVLKTRITEIKHNMARFF
jgi:hypothetical protein